MISLTIKSTEVSIQNNQQIEMINKKLLDKYNVIFMDLWGVVFDGQVLYPQARETLERLRKTGKKVILLTNAPLRKEKIANICAQFNIHSTLYYDIVSSGDLVHSILKKGNPYGSKYFYIGSKKNILEGLPGYKEVARAQEADFSIITSVLNCYDESLVLADKSLAANLPLLCINPDKIFITQSGNITYRSGMVAKRYEEKGGKVLYFGKPHKAIYEHAMKIASAKNSEILAVGDSIHNDIIGANNMNIASVLVCSGVHREEFNMKIGELPKNIFAEIRKKHSITPDYVISLLRDLVF